MVLEARSKASGAAARIWGFCIRALAYSFDFSTVAANACSPMRRCACCGYNGWSRLKGEFRDAIAEHVFPFKEIENEVLEWHKAAVYFPRRDDVGDAALRR